MQVLCLRNAKSESHFTKRIRRKWNQFCVMTMGKFSSVETNLAFISTKSLNNTMRLVLAIFFSCLCEIPTVEGKFKLQAYETSRVCPDLQESIIGKDESVFQIAKYSPSSDWPCLLKSSDRGARKRVALIAAIHGATKPWNFSYSANTCRDQIKVRIPKPNYAEKSDDDLNMICKVPRKPELFVKLNNSNFGIRLFFEFALRDMDYHTIPHPKNPSLYDLGNGKLVISFSNFNLSIFNDSNLVYSDNEQQHHSVTNYIQIIFIVRTSAGDCYVQIQQYRIKFIKEMSCKYLHELYPFRLCGVYECDEIGNILRVNGLRHFEIHWKAKTHVRPEIMYRPAKPTTTTGRPKRRELYNESRLTALALLLVASLLISVVYNVFRFLLCTSFGGDSGSQIGNCNGNSDVTVRPPPTTTVAMMVASHNVIPLVQIGTEEDPPPSYDCLDKLPTYEEATILGRN